MENHHPSADVRNRAPDSVSHANPTTATEQANKRIVSAELYDLKSDSNGMMNQAQKPAERLPRKDTRRLLFLCSQNKLRSPTAEVVFRDHPGVETDSAGLNHDAEVPLSVEQIKWADFLLVMEKGRRNRLNRKFGAHLAGKKIVVLNIPDDYDFMAPELIEILRIHCRAYLP